MPTYEYLCRRCACVFDIRTTMEEVSEIERIIKDVTIKKINKLAHSLLKRSEDIDD